MPIHASALALLDVGGRITSQAPLSSPLSNPSSRGGYASWTSDELNRELEARGLSREGSVQEHAGRLASDDWSSLMTSPDFLLQFISVMGRQQLATASAVSTSWLAACTDRCNQKGYGRLLVVGGHRRGTGGQAEHFSGRISQSLAVADVEQFDALNNSWRVRCTAMRQTKPSNFDRQAASPQPMGLAVLPYSSFHCVVAASGRRSLHSRRKGAILGSASTEIVFTPLEAQPPC